MHLKDYRGRADLTGPELAKRAGCSPSLISHLETGRRNWRATRVEVLRAIVAALNQSGVPCTLDDVFPPADASAA